MNSRERVLSALNHRAPDRIPLDLGASAVTGMHVASVYLLRQALKLDPPGTPVKVVEPYQMLGEIAPDLVQTLGVDVLPLAKRETLFGFRNQGWRPWNFNGTPVLVPQGFNTQPEADGSIFMYPDGDPSAPPSGKMPAGGYYFDTIIRQPPIDDDHLDPADNLEEFGPISDDDLAYLGAEAERLYTTTDKALLANFGGTAFGDIALVPAPWLKHPKGIRDVAEWYMSTVSRQDYIYEVLNGSARSAWRTWKKSTRWSATGCAPPLSPARTSAPRPGRLSPPGLTARCICHFIRRSTLDPPAHPWKSFIHSCGSVAALIPDFIEAGFDILNPVQTSAAGMEARAVEGPVWRRPDFLGRRGGHAENPALRHARTGARRCARAHGHLWRGRRVRVQRHPQHPGPHPGREPAGPVRDR